MGGYEGASSRCPWTPAPVSCPCLLPLPPATASCPCLQLLPPAPASSCCLLSLPPAAASCPCHQPLPPTPASCPCHQLLPPAAASCYCLQQQPLAAGSCYCPAVTAPCPCPLLLPAGERGPCQRLLATAGAVPAGHWRRTGKAEAAATATGCSSCHAHGLRRRGGGECLPALLINAMAVAGCSRQ